LYGNLYDVKFDTMIDDVKLYNNDYKDTGAEWLSVFDGWIGDSREYPNLNNFLTKTFPEKCIYEV